MSGFNADTFEGYLSDEDFANAAAHNDGALQLNISTGVEPSRNEQAGAASPSTSVQPAHRRISRWKEYATATPEPAPTLIPPICYDGVTHVPLDHRPTVLFDLNGVLIAARGEEDRKVKHLHKLVPRPDLRYIAALVPTFRIGIYTSATSKTLAQRLPELEEWVWADDVARAHLRAHGVYPKNTFRNIPPELTLAQVECGRRGAPGKPKGRAPRPLFEVKLTREHCRPDTNWASRPAGKEWDTVKPLALHDLPLTRTVLIDDSVRKSIPEEEGCCVAVPTFTGRRGAGDGAHASVEVLRTVVALLLGLNLSEDLRVGLPLVRLDLEQALQHNLSARLAEVLEGGRADAPFPDATSDPAAPTEAPAAAPEAPEAPAAASKAKKSGKAKGVAKAKASAAQKAAAAVEVALAAQKAPVAALAPVVADAFGPGQPKFQAVAYEDERSNALKPMPAVQQRGNRVKLNKALIADPCRVATMPAGSVARYILRPPPNGVAVDLPSDPRPTLLIELRALLPNFTIAYLASKVKRVWRERPISSLAQQLGLPVRPGAEQLATLAPSWRLGVYTTLPHELAWLCTAYLDKWLWHYCKEHLVSCNLSRFDAHLAHAKKCSATCEAPGTSHDNEQEPSQQLPQPQQSSPPPELQELQAQQQPELQQGLQEQQPELQQEAQPLTQQSLQEQQPKLQEQQLPEPQAQPQPPLQLELQEQQPEMEEQPKEQQPEVQEQPKPRRQRRRRRPNAGSSRECKDGALPDLGPGEPTENPLAPPEQPEAHSQPLQQPEAHEQQPQQRPQPRRRRPRRRPNAGISEQSGGDAGPGVRSGRPADDAGAGPDMGPGEHSGDPSWQIGDAAALRPMLFDFVLSSRNCWPDPVDGKREPLKRPEAHGLEPQRTLLLDVADLRPGAEGSTPRFVLPAGRWRLSVMRAHEPGSVAQLRQLGAARAEMRASNRGNDWVGVDGSRAAVAATASTLAASGLIRSGAPGGAAEGADGEPKGAEAAAGQHWPLPPAEHGTLDSAGGGRPVLVAACNALRLAGRNAANLDPGAPLPVDTILGGFEQALAAMVPGSRDDDDLPQLPRPGPQLPRPAPQLPTQEAYVTEGPPEAAELDTAASAPRDALTNGAACLVEPSAPTPDEAAGDGGDEAPGPLARHKRPRQPSDDEAAAAGGTAAKRLRSENDAVCERNVLLHKIQVVKSAYHVAFTEPMSVPVWYDAAKLCTDKNAIFALSPMSASCAKLVQAARGVELPTKRPQPPESIAVLVHAAARALTRQGCGVAPMAGFIAACQLLPSRRDSKGGANAPARSKGAVEQSIEKYATGLDAASRAAGIFSTYDLRLLGDGVSKTARKPSTQVKWYLPLIAQAFWKPRWRVLPTPAIRDDALVLPCVIHRLSCLTDDKDVNEEEASNSADAAAASARLASLLEDLYAKRDDEVDAAFAYAAPAEPAVASQEHASEARQGAHASALPDVIEAAAEVLERRRMTTPMHIQHLISINCPRLAETSPANYFTRALATWLGPALETLASRGAVRIRSLRDADVLGVPLAEQVSERASCADIPLADRFVEVLQRPDPEEVRKALDGIECSHLAASLLAPGDDDVRARERFWPGLSPGGADMGPDESEASRSTADVQACRARAHAAADKADSKPRSTKAVDLRRAHGASQGASAASRNGADAVASDTVSLQATQTTQGDAADESTEAPLKGTAKRKAQGSAASSAADGSGPEEPDALSAGEVAERRRKRRKLKKQEKRQAHEAELAEEVAALREERESHVAVPLLPGAAAAIDVMAAMPPDAAAAGDASAPPPPDAAAVADASPGTAVAAADAAAGVVESSPGAAYDPQAAAAVAANRSTLDAYRVLMQSATQAAAQALAAAPAQASEPPAKKQRSAGRLKRAKKKTSAAAPAGQAKLGWCGSVDDNGLPEITQGGASGSQPRSEDGRLSALHHEVYDFAVRAAPRPEEIQDITLVLQAIDETAKQLWSTARAVLFGSQPAGLSLPSSDLDVVIMGAVPFVGTPATGFTRAQKDQVTNVLRQLSSALTSRGLQEKRHVNLVQHAKVPIIKTFMRVPGSEVGISVDISAGMANGSQAVFFAQRQVQALPPLRPLLLIVKAFLKEQSLNEVISGGVSSYSLLNMMIAHLQHEGLQPASLAEPARAPVSEDVATQLLFLRTLAEAAWANDSADAAAHWSPRLDLGHLLLGFFKRFGFEFSHVKHGVSIHQGGVVSRAATGAEHPRGLALEDPQERGRSIGAGSHRIADVIVVFKQAWSRLTTAASRADGARDNTGVNGGRAHNGRETGDVEDEAAAWASVQADGSHRSVSVLRARRQGILESILDVEAIVGPQGP